MNISSHKDLFRSEVTLQEINEAAEARKKHDNDQEVLRLEKDQLNFHNMRMDLAPCLYDDDLAQLLKSSLKGSGSWITQNDAFLKWWKDDSFNQVLWICGIPGAGMSKEMQATLWKYLGIDQLVQEKQGSQQVLSIACEKMKTGIPHSYFFAMIQPLLTNQ